MHAIYLEGGITLDDANHLTFFLHDLLYRSVHFLISQHCI